MFPNEQQLRLMFSTAGTAAVQEFLGQVKEMADVRLQQLDPNHLPANYVRAEILETHALVSNETISTLNDGNRMAQDALTVAHEMITELANEGDRLRAELKQAQDALVQFQSETAPVEPAQEEKPKPKNRKG